MSTPGAAATRDRGRVRPATIAIAVIIVGFSAMWIYAWFFAPRGNIDRFPDRAWADAAERVCTATGSRLEELPAAATFASIEPKAEALRQRADVIDEATTLLDQQVAALYATQPADAKSQEGVGLWLADWDGYLRSRRVHAEALRAGEDRQFAVQEQGGAPVTLRMDAFAKTNGMPSCIVPDDIG